MQFPLPFAPVGLLSPIRFAIARSWPQLIRRERQPMFWTVITRFFHFSPGFFPIPVCTHSAGRTASQQASKQALPGISAGKQARKQASKEGRKQARKQASQSASKQASQRCFSHLTATSKSLRRIVSKLFICIQTISDINS